MVAVVQAVTQCVVWFGSPSRREMDALAAAGWRLRVAELSGNPGVGLRAGDTVVGVVDLRHGLPTGPEALRRLAEEQAHLPLIAILPAQDGAAGQARALLQHCVHTLPAPLDLARMMKTLDALGPAPARGRGRGVEALVGRSAVMRATQATIHKFAPVDLPVLITGATGTGKEVAARALHELSPRQARPFAAVNCGALPPNLVQSELFGHERGAFTGATGRRAGLFEGASGGTVFLDEVGDLPLDAQTSLLRVLQEGCVERIGSHQPVPVDVRVLAATNVDLEEAVANGRFRSDLYYRLNVLRLAMPPLARRGEDIEVLAQHFLDEFRLRHETRARGFSPAARRAMRAFAWPGNVRELLNRVQRAAVVAESELVTPAELELPLPVGDGDGDGHDGDGLDRARLAAEYDAIVHCLRDSGFNISEVARRLKVSRVTVYRLCRKHRLKLEELRCR